MSSHDQATANLAAHAKAIDDLHHKLAAMPGVNAQRLAAAVDKYKAAHQQFCNDALGCMN